MPRHICKQNSHRINLVRIPRNRRTCELHEQRNSHAFRNARYKDVSKTIENQQQNCILEVHWYLNVYNVQFKFNSSVQKEITLFICQVCHCLLKSIKMT